MLLSADFDTCPVCRILDFETANECNSTNLYFALERCLKRGSFHPFVAVEPLIEVAGASIQFYFFTKWKMKRSFYTYTTHQDKH